MSSELLHSLFDKFWKKWPSYSILVIIIVTTLANSIPEKWDIGDHGAIKFYSIAFVSLILLIWYAIICVKENTLPKAKGLSVLFIIDTESDELYQEVKHKLVTNFSDCFDREDAYAFSALCLPFERISKYDLQKKKDTLDLLKRQIVCSLFVLGIMLTAYQMRRTSRWRSITELFIQISKRTLPKYSKLK